MLFADSDPRPVSTRLAAWSTMLAVVAHPDDESFGLGAILDAFHRAGTGTVVLCLTRGEASTLHGVAGELTAVRGREFAAAARTLGVTDTVLRDFPDGALGQVCRSLVVGEVIDAARAMRADGLLVFDPSGVTGHPDHAAATAAALLAAAGLDLRVLGWTLPVDRAKQTAACAAHVSQAIPTSVLWRRLELLGDTEYLRWLSNPPAAEEALEAERGIR